MGKNWCKRYAQLRQRRVYRIVRVNRNKTEPPGFYDHTHKLDIGFEAEKTTKSFFSGINHFYIRAGGNFYIFCEFFCLDPTDYKSEEKFIQFQRLAQTLNKFTREELAQMIEAGWRLLDDN